MMRYSLVLCFDEKSRQISSRKGGDIIVLSVTYFTSAMVEPAHGVSNTQALAVLLARVEVSSAKVLDGPFISVRFKEPMDRAGLSAFKQALESVIRVSEKRAREPEHGIRGGDWL